MRSIYESVADWYPHITSRDLTVEIVANKYSLPLLLDRSLLGEVGVSRITGRRLSDYAVAIARGAYHQLLFRQNPAYENRTLLASFVVYAWKWPYSSWPVDNFGVNMLNFTAPAYYETVTSNFSHAYHTEASAVATALDQGALLWYYSGHGIAGSGFGLFAPDACRAWESGGSTADPDQDGDGWVNPPFNQYVLISEFNESLESLRSAIFVSLGCASGAWDVPLVMQRHGASAQYACATSHYGVLGEKMAIDVIKGLAEGMNIGESVRKAAIRYAHIWSYPDDPEVVGDWWSRQKRNSYNFPTAAFGDYAVKLVLDVDSDGDGITDTLELVLGTNATRSDSDGDGISDGLELYMGTSPLLSDTDGDGFSDSSELQLGTNPLEAEVTQLTTKPPMVPLQALTAMIAAAPALLVRRIGPHKSSRAFIPAQFFFYP